MTDTPHNLDQDDQEFFEFQVSGKNYRMRYPTVEEVEQAQGIKEDTKQTDWVYSFIEPVDKESPDIRTALKKKNIKVLQRFNKMVTTEFGE